MKEKNLILIIDDEPDFVDTVRFFLENANFRVICAADGKSGLLQASRKPDLILLDLNLPGLSGHEICKLLKDNPATAYIPIIMLTVQDRTLDKVEALNLGVADYIVKDTPFEEIAARINAVIREKTRALSPQAKKEKTERVLALRRIIDEKSLRTFFQPILLLADRSIIGYEALTRGPVGTPFENALQLFTLAHELNMYAALDTLSHMLAAQRAGFINESQTLFLNTDPEVIDQPRVRSLGFLQGSKIQPHQLCLEITERTCIRSFAKLSSSLARLKDKGIRIAIDDVGEGYSSLKAVAELRPDFIKIDIGLIRGVDADGVKKTLVQALLEFSRKLPSRVVAEGIETEEEYHALCQLGVEYGQGYLFARPSEKPQQIPSVSPP